MSEVDKSKIALWVAALRSGEYRQGQKFLHRIGDDGGHQLCCLGVACEVAQENGVELDVVRTSLFYSPSDREGDGKDITVFIYNRAMGFPPVEVLNWFGLRNGEDFSLGVEEHGHPVTPVSANDVLGWDFAKIADRLEAVYLTDQAVEEKA